MDLEKIKRILRRYGCKAQLVKAAEELTELQLILLQDHNKNFVYDTTEINEELADVYIMLEQIKLIYSIDEIELNAEIDYKLHRQLKRIENEQTETFVDNGILYKQFKRVDE